MSNEAKAIHLPSLDEENLPPVDPILPIQELFTFSPFGLGCRQCKDCVTIQIDERCISRHLKKHGMDSRIVTVTSLLDMFKAQIKNVKTWGTIEPYRIDNMFYEGYSCICGQSFHSRKASAVRHCKRLGCDPSKLQKVELIKLCCGRYVTQAQVTSFFSDVPRRSQQFDYRLTRATLLPFLPLRGRADF